VLEPSGADCRFANKLLGLLLHLLDNGDILPEHNGGHQPNEQNLGRHTHKKIESKPTYLSSMERHLLMTVFRIQIAGLEANLTVYVWLLMLSTCISFIYIWWVGVLRNT